MEQHLPHGKQVDHVLETKAATEATSKFVAICGVYLFAVFPKQNIWTIM